MLTDYYYLLQKYGIVRVLTIEESIALLQYDLNYG